MSYKMPINLLGYLNVGILLQFIGLPINRKWKPKFCAIEDLIIELMNLLGSHTP